VATLLLVSRSLLPMLALCALLVAACGSDGAEESPPEDDAAAPVQTASTPDSGCKDVDTPKPGKDGGERKPTQNLEPTKTYDVTLETSCGSFTIRLDQKKAPNTAASFASLTRNGFYDGTVFHRIVPGFVIQGGDPTGTGTGGPGYSVVDEPPGDAAYTRGVVAMAKTGDEPPGTAGSQFYVVTGQDAGLPPEYALLGKVVKGMDVTMKIDALGDPQSGGAGTPLQTVVIEKATLKER
jgi:peptidyl-prolyl cis-trans isomerase B (cyclophilin B)